MANNKTVWKTVKPLFSNKGNIKTKIKLVEKHQTLEIDNKVTEELNLLI